MNLWRVLFAPRFLRHGVCAIALLNILNTWYKKFASEIGNRTSFLLNPNCVIPRKLTQIRAKKLAQKMTTKPLMVVCELVSTFFFIIHRLSFLILQHNTWIPVVIGYRLQRGLSLQLFRRRLRYGKTPSRNTEEEVSKMKPYYRS